MIRRTFLKALCASPLGFLIPKQKQTFDEVLRKIVKEFDSHLAQMDETTISELVSTNMSFCIYRVWDGTKWGKEMVTPERVL